jgi:two-component system, OmpR family, sensor histidine kinase MtrB
MSIQKALLIVAVPLVLTAFAAAIALIVLTELIDRDTDNLGTEVSQVHLVETAQIDLLTHSRTTEAIARSVLETDARVALEASEHQFAHPHERSAVKEARNAIESYFALPDDRMLENALGALNRLLARHFESAEQSRVEAHRWDKIGSAVGILVAVLLATLVTAVLFAARSFVIDPILHLNDAMKRFGSGSRDVHVLERGPQEIAAIAAQFNQMSRALARQHEHELTFLAGVAHDLRNPLSALRLSAESIPANGPLPSESTFRRLMSLIARQTKHLERMVSDLLDTARIEAGDLELRNERCNAAELVIDTLDLFRSSTSKHELSSRVPDHPVEVVADPVRLTQVLNNLVSNAIKYSPEGGSVCLALEDHRDRAIFVVSDQGRGIAPGELEHVFEPFRRGTITRDEIPGVGLGLSVARRIVEAHGGRIDVESEVGRGTTFRITIPTERSPA